MSAPANVAGTVFDVGTLGGNLDHAVEHACWRTAGR